MELFRLKATKTYQKPNNNTREWSGYKNKEQHRPGVGDGRNQHMSLSLGLLFIVYQEDDAGRPHDTDKCTIPCREKWKT